MPILAALLVAPAAVAQSDDSTRVAMAGCWQLVPPEDMQRLLKEDARRTYSRQRCFDGDGAVEVVTCEGLDAVQCATKAEAYSLSDGHVVLTAEDGTPTMTCEIAVTSETLDLAGCAAGDKAPVSGESYMRVHQ